MTKNCTVIRYNKSLQETDGTLCEMLERFRQINLSDRSQWANTTVVFTRQLYNMLQLSRVIAQGAALRDESRGAHYKPDFPERDDKRFLGHSLVRRSSDGTLKVEYLPVKITRWPPGERVYGQEEKKPDTIKQAG